MLTRRPAPLAEVVRLPRRPFTATVLLDLPTRCPGNDADGPMGVLIAVPFGLGHVAKRRRSTSAEIREVMRAEMRRGDRR